MDIKIIESGKDLVTEYFSVGALDEEENIYSKGMFRYRNIAFGDGYAKAMTAGAIATPVHLRRGGNVRRMFDFMHKKAYEDGVGAAVLHPFSFAYYNKFGYSKIADHLIVKCPIRYIDFVPRECTLVPYSTEMLGDIVSVYREFIRGRHLLFERAGEEQFTRYKDASIYMFYNGKKPEGYIIYKTQKTLMTNHFEDGVMSVLELVYTTRAALEALMSFIRMYEGELEDVEFLNLSMTPEVDLILRNYTHTRYSLLPDISAKILNTKYMLERCVYPEREGSLRLCVQDGDEGVKGGYLVEWGGGDCRVSNISDDSDIDATVSSLALPRLIFGYDNISKTTLPYLSGVEIHKNPESFIAAFPKKCTGIFEHF